MFEDIAYGRCRPQRAKTMRAVTAALQRIQALDSATNQWFVTMQFRHVIRAATVSPARPADCDPVRFAALMLSVARRHTLVRWDTHGMYNSREETP